MARLDSSHYLRTDIAKVAGGRPQELCRTCRVLGMVCEEGTEVVGAGALGQATAILNWE